MAKTPNSQRSIALAPLVSLCKKSGASRVSKKATKAMSNVLEEIGIEIAVRAVKLAKHAGRKTVKEADIVLAKEEIWG